MLNKPLHEERNRLGKDEFYKQYVNPEMEAEVKHYESTRTKQIPGYSIITQKAKPSPRPKSPKRSKEEIRTTVRRLMHGK